MSRAQRLLALVQLLRGHRRPAAGALLAGELRISLRSLYRDIATLRGEGAPIDGEPGVGFVLGPGFMLPPLMFTPDEIEALALGGKWVAAQPDAPLRQAARAALAKIAAVLPPGLRASIDDGTLLVSTPAAAGDADLSAIRLAIRAERKLRITYLDAAGVSSERVIWPFALGFFERVRVAAAWCELRQDMRHFRTDRIGALEALPERYPRRRQTMLKEWRAREGVAET